MRKHRREVRTARPSVQETAPAGACLEGQAVHSASKWGRSRGWVRGRPVAGRACLFACRRYNKDKLPFVPGAMFFARPFLKGSFFGVFRSCGSGQGRCPWTLPPFEKGGPKLWPLRYAVVCVGCAWSPTLLQPMSPGTSQDLAQP